MCPWRSQQTAGNQWVTSEIFGKGSWNIRKSSWGFFRNLVVWCCFWALVLAWILVGQDMCMRFWLAFKRKYRFQCNQPSICTFERQLIQLQGFHSRISLRPNSAGWFTPKFHSYEISYHRYHLSQWAGWLLLIRELPTIRFWVLWGATVNSSCRRRLPWCNARSFWLQHLPNSI